eukprot:403336507
MNNSKNQAMKQLIDDINQEYQNYNPNKEAQQNIDLAVKQTIDSARKIIKNQSNGGLLKTARVMQNTNDKDGLVQNFNQTSRDKSIFGSFTNNNQNQDSQFFEKRQSSQSNLHRKIPSIQINSTSLRKNSGGKANLEIIQSQKYNTQSSGSQIQYDSKGVFKTNKIKGNQGLFPGSNLAQKIQEQDDVIKNMLHLEIPPPNTAQTGRDTLLSSSTQSRIPKKHTKLNNFYNSQFTTMNNINVNLNFQDMNIKTQGMVSNPEILKLREQVQQNLKDLEMKRLAIQHQKKFQENININYRQYFSQKKGFSKVFDEINNVNVLSVDLIKALSCYKYELSQIQQDITVSYNSIFENLLEQCFMSDKDTLLQVESKIKDNAMTEREFEKQRSEFQEKIFHLKLKLKAKNLEIKFVKETSQMYEDEVAALRDIIKSEVMNAEIQQIKKRSGGNKQEEEDKEERNKVFKSISDNPMFSSNLTDLQNIMNEMETEQLNKESILKDMEKFQKAILRANKINASTQVDEGELFWKPENFIGNPNSKQPNIKSTSVDGGQQMTEIKFREQYQFQVPTQNININQNIVKLKKEDQEFSNKIGLDNNKETVAAKDGIFDLAKVKSMAQDLADNWNIPAYIIAFISNSLDSNLPGRVLPWVYFRKQIYEIYDERIKYAPEIQGFINSNYISLEEFMILYFLKKYQLRRLAEIKLIEFITSLKYYMKIWTRAKVFANLAGMLQMGDAMSTDASNHSSDIYMQEFYYYSYSQYQRIRDQATNSGTGQTMSNGLIEHNEESTYVSVEKEPLITRLVLFWMNQSEIARWNHKLKRFVKKIPDSQGNETEQLDLDLLLNMYLEEFVARKKKNQKTLTKMFVKQFQEQDGIFSFEEIKNICKAVQPEDSFSPIVSYPSDIIYSRTFLFSLTSGKNTFEITSKDFLEAAFRNGIDNPYPTIQKRINIYGNDIDLEMLLQELTTSEGSLTQFQNLHMNSNFGSATSTQGGNRSVMNKRAGKDQAGLSFGMNNAGNQSRTNADLRQVNGNKSTASGFGLNKDANIFNQKSAFDNNNNRGSPLKGGKQALETKLVIPSFNASTALFAQHFSILRELKKNIEDLKKKKEASETLKEQNAVMDKIINHLDSACQFLNFPVQM